MNRKRYDNCPRCNKPCIGLTENCQVSKEQLIEQIYTALTDLYINEMYLIKVHVNEVCLSSYFWYYFKLRNQKCYTGLNIDPEYNRNDTAPKRYFSLNLESEHMANPDMLIHQRGCNKHKFAYLEFKTNNTDMSLDYKKIKSFTSQGLNLDEMQGRYIYR